MEGESIAELCGIIMGDGHIHTSANRVTITGSLEDSVYHKQWVAMLFKANFNVKPIFFMQRAKNANYLQVESEQCINHLLSLGLERGPKLNLSMPQFINTPDLKICFLRGLFDTDGWLKLSPQNRRCTFYHRIRLTLKESPLARKIGDILLELGFNSSIWVDMRTTNAILTYEISGRRNAMRWFDLIMPRNAKHIKRYSAWRDGKYNTKA